MEEHRPDQGHHQDSGPPSGTSRRLLPRPDYLRNRPQGPRPPLRHRLHEAETRIGLGTKPAIRGRHRKDREMVLGERGLDGECNERGVSEVL